MTVHRVARTWYWLVGESPSMATIGRPEACLLPSDSGIPNSVDRLLALTGWTEAEYLAIFRRRENLWDHQQRLWIDVGRQHAARIARESAVDGSAGVVVMGAKVAAAFELGEGDLFTWVGRYALVPHASGRCRYWNVPDARARAAAFFESLRRCAPSVGSDQSSLSTG